MKNFSLFLLFSGIVALIPATGISQETGDAPKLLTTPSPSHTTLSVLASKHLPPQLPRLQFLGMYQPNGVFTSSSVMPSRFLGGNGGSVRHKGSERFVEVPPFINLDSKEEVVANFKPPNRAVLPAKGHSLLGTFRDRVVLLAYGRQNLFRAPTHIVADSRQRIIISDPDLKAVHVLDATGKSAFRIAGGPQHRVLSPDAIAVDSQDNIYVADGSTGIVQVFDPGGQFLRTIGFVKGERRFETPTAIAVGQKTGLLYILDAPAGELVVCNLAGDVMRRISSRSKTGVGFNYPTEIASAGDQVFVLDDFGARVQVFDADFNLLHTFRVKIHDGSPKVNEVGLSVDSSGRIYLSNLFPDQIAVYDENGRLVGLFGHSGVKAEEFRMPSGIWIDPAGRIYITDTDNSRVQVFRKVESVSQIASADASR